MGVTESPEELANRLERETLLSPMESQVTALRLTGHSWTEIADHFGISRATARTYYERVERKSWQAQATVKMLQEVGFNE